MAATVVERIWVHPDEKNTAGDLAAVMALVPAKGALSNPETLQAAGWKTIGSITKFGDDADLASDAVEVTPIREGAMILPPGAQTAIGQVIRHNGVESVTFKAYDLSREIQDLDSGAAEHETFSNVVVHAPVLSRRSLVVEYRGERCDFYPAVQLQITDLSAGYGVADGDVSVTGLEARVFAADEAPGGCLMINLEAAGT